MTAHGNPDVPPAMRWRTHNFLASIANHTCMKERNTMATNAKPKTARTPASDGNANAATRPEETAATAVTVSAEAETREDNDKDAATPKQDAPKEDESVKPVSAPPAHRVDSRIPAIAATIILEFPEGATVADLIGKLGFDERETLQLLSAMENYDAAVRHPGNPDRWTLGSAKPSTVDLSDLPPCAHCGEYPSLVAANGGVKSASIGNGRVNGDNNRAYKPKEFWPILKAYIDALAPGKKLQPGVAARELSTQEKRVISSGTVAYAVKAMLDDGFITVDPR